LFEVAEPLVTLSKELGFDLVFKASFDKANRTSINSYRGPGLEKTLTWFRSLKDKYDVKVLTDVHETSHCRLAAEVCDVLQIPAFLCRQTDLILAAVETGRAVNLKKGQFIGPESLPHLANKLKSAAQATGAPQDFALTERGVSFGYGNLVVDCRIFRNMAAMGGGVIFDATHSLQKPGQGGQSGEITGGAREFAPLLLRSAVATGYTTGFFMEVHPAPNRALSDATTQLSIQQATLVLRQAVPIWREAKSWTRIDEGF
jgi:2-dehydro-3-deoxyphosphooctonate aldolase (KDO 8-P synthase)